jgi:hypothetical protein
MLISRYAAVGLLERFQDTLRLFEAVAPRWFANLTDVYEEMSKAEAAGNGHMRTHPAEHPHPSESSIEVLRSNHRQDVALYEHAQRRFASVISGLSAASPIT